MTKQDLIDIQATFLQLMENAKTEEERDFFDGLAFYTENYIKEKFNDYLS